MTSTRKFYRTVIEVEVLSEEPYNPTSLSQIDSDIDDGPCPGQWKVTIVTAMKE